MAPFNGIPTYQQQVALALAPKFAASLSILGSSYIFYDCTIGFAYKNQQHQQHHSQRRSSTTTYHRLMIGLAVCDILMSVGLFTSTWPMPVDTPHVWGAVGTVSSCEAIGFLEQAGVAAVLYNASLSFYYLFRIRYGWSCTKILSRELFLHLVPIGFGLATMIAALWLNLYNSGLFDCWIAPFPQGCVESWQQQQQGTKTTCERGDNASLYQWLFDVIPKWASVWIVTINMWLTHRAVRKQEQASLRFSLQQRRRPRAAQRLARQSYCYVGALYLTYIPVVVTRLTELITGSVYYGMLLTISITIPLQGFWNVLVYLRPRYLRERERQQSRRRQRQQEQNSQPETSLMTMSSNNNSGGRVISTGHEIIRAISEAVREGCLSDEDEEDEEDNDKSDEYIGDNDDNGDNNNNSGDECSTDDGEVPKESPATSITSNTNDDDDNDNKQKPEREQSVQSLTETIREESMSSLKVTPGDG